MTNAGLIEYASLGERIDRGFSMLDSGPLKKSAPSLERQRDAKSSVEERPPEYDSDKYFSHLLDQYKTYVEMADRMSARKILVMNTFMTIMGAAAIAYASAPNYFGKEFVLFFQLGITMVSFLIALMWRSFMIHHSKVSDTKFKVIHEIEELLPAQPYRMEYEYCVKERKTASALSRIDRYLPLIAAVLSAAGFVYAIIAHITP